MYTVQVSKVVYSCVAIECVYVCMYGVLVVIILLCCVCVCVCVQYFAEALTQVTHLHVYPGMMTALQPLFHTTDQQIVRR